MLTAIYRKKTRIYKRYIEGKKHEVGGLGEGESARIPAEDEITSLLFDALQYMSAAHVEAIWRELLSEGGKKAFMPKEVGAVRAKVQFWPSSNKVEPDLHIDFKWPSGEQRIILIEVKWNAPLSGEDQLWKQWNEYLRPEQQKVAQHVFIGKTKDIGESHGHDVVALTWRNVLEVSRSLSNKSSPVGSWGLMVSGFLTKTIPGPFNGFSSMTWGDWKGVSSFYSGRPYFFFGGNGLNFNQCKFKFYKCND